ncbi:MAG: polysaccharide biosynthesis C-terminal domain-containing protein [Bacteroidetes bacterium]|nr:polysaccharide biosynthesis C-terminal domain-containing protein [Bacteroidota bacterium]
MISKNFIKSSITYSLVGSLPLASGFILLPIFAVHLGASLYGQLALYTAFTMLIQIIINLSLDYGLQITYFENKTEKINLNKRLGTLVSGMLIVGTLFIILLTVTGSFLFRNIFPNSGLEFYPFGFYSLITAFFNGFSKSYNNLLINQQKPVRFLWINLLNFSLTVVLTIILLLRFPNTLTGPITARAIAAGIVFLLSLCLLIRQYPLSFDWVFFSTMVVVCFPVLVNYLLNWSLGYSDRFIITSFLSTRETGIFDFALKTTFAIDIFLTGIYSTVSPKLLNHLIGNDIRKSDKYYNSYFNAMTAFIILLIPSTILAVQIIIPMFHVKPDYLFSLKYVGLISISFLFRVLGMMYSTPIYAFKKTRLLPKIFGMAAVIQIILSIILIKYFGIIGAVASMILNRPIQVLLTAWQTRKIFDFTFNHRKMITLPLIYFGIFIASEILTINKPHLWLYWIEMVLAVVLIIIFFRNEIRIMKDELMKKLLPTK